MSEVNFKIDKYIEIPENYPKKYPFEDMDIGDSFRVPWEFAHHARQKIYLYHSASKLRFKTKKLYENKNLVIRIWRTE